MSSTAPDTRTTAAIYEEAANTNDQVTDRLKNALRIVDDTREVQADTLADLKKQGEQLEDVQDALDDVQEDTTYAQAVLDDIGCLCWCFGRKKSNKMQRPIHPPKYTPPSTGTTSKPNGVQKMTRNEIELQDASKGTTSKGTTTTTEDPVLKRIEEGKEEQDNLMDQISNGLDVLAKGAKAMGEELTTQDEKIDVTEKRADDATQNTKETVRHSAFRRHIGNYM